MNNRKIKVGIIGFGKMGVIRAKAILNSGLGEVVAIYDPNITESIFLLCNSEDDLLNSGVQAIFICTPNYKIKNLTIRAINLGIHVFAEKPPGINLSETEEMNEVLLNHPNTTLMFGFNHRHHGSIIKMKEIIDQNLMGKVLWMRGRYGKEVDENFFKGWRVDKNLSGGGIMLDQGIHMLDLFLHLGGEFHDVKSFVSNLYWNIPGIEDNVFAIFKNNETGLCASLHSTMTQWRYIFSLEIFLENGSLILNGLKTSSGAYGDEVLTIKYNNTDSAHNKEEQTIYKEDTSWDREVNHFFECIISSSEPKFGKMSHALSLMKVMDKIYTN